MTSQIGPEQQPQQQPQPTNASSPPYESLHAYPFETDAAFLNGLASILGHSGTPPTRDEQAQNPDIVLRAKCFYYNRKFKTVPPFTVAGYKSWLASRTVNGEVPESTEQSATQPSQTTPQTTASLENEAQQQQQPPPPPYPTSFAEIVDLITNNKPIPGIQEIPSTVLELGSSKRDTATRRRKPWEKVETEGDAEVGTETALFEEVTVPVTAENHNGIERAGNDNDETGMDKDVLATASMGDDGSSRPARVSEMSRYRRKDEGLLRILRPDAVPDSGLIARD